MTKSIVITYQEDDEPLLMALFRKFKIMTREVKNYGENGVPVYVADDIIEGFKLIKKYENGEIELPLMKNLL